MIASFSPLECSYNSFKHKSTILGYSANLPSYFGPVFTNLGEVRHLSDFLKLYKDLRENPSSGGEFLSSPLVASIDSVADAQGMLHFPGGTEFHSANISGCFRVHLYARPLREGDCFPSQ